MKKIFTLIGVIIVLVFLAGMIKFNILSGLSGFDVDGNKIKDNSEHYQEIEIIK